MRNLYHRLNASFLRLAARFLPPCHEVTRLLSQGMDQPLPWATRLRLHVHFLGCIWCRRYKRQLQALRTFARSFPERGGEGGLPGLSTQARVRIEAALREETRR